MGTRLEGAIGARFGSYLLNNVSTGSNVQGHLDAGLRNDRWFVYGEYGLMVGIAWIAWMFDRRDVQ